MHDVVVVGGGIAGLTAAFKLSQAGLKTVVLEAAETAGGNIRTLSVAGFKLETGPYSFLGSSEAIWKLTEELGIEELAEPSSAAADNRFIYRDGRLLPLPLSPVSFITSPLISPRGKLRLLAEPFIRNGARPDDTAWQFFVRRFGREAATYVMGPFISGIYAGDPQLLGARAAFTKFYDFERESGSMIVGALKYMRAKRRRMRRENITVRRGLYSFTGGLGAITVQLARRLDDAVRTGVSVLAVGRDADGAYVVDTSQGQWQARAVVLAAPPPQAAGILAGLLPRAAELLTTIPMAAVTLIHWSQPKTGAGNGSLPVGFGFLMPRLYDLRVLGTIFASQLFAGRAPEDKLLFSSFYGGMTDRAATELSDAATLDLLLAEHRRIFGVELAPPELVRILRYPAAIPQLLPDHPERVAELQRELAQAPGLILAGNYLTGVGMEHAVASGYSAADGVLARLAGAGRTDAAEGRR